MDAVASMMPFNSSHRWIQGELSWEQPRTSRAKTDVASLSIRHYIIMLLVPTYPAQFLLAMK